MAYNLSYKPYGERAIFIEWPAIIDEEILRDVLSFKHKIEKLNIKSLLEIRQSYNSLLVVYGFVEINFKAEIETINKIYSKSESAISLDLMQWTIPVCYEEEFGIDLEELSGLKNVTKSQIIEWHSQSIYTVYFIGFLPGFLYLGGLDKRLHTPRKSTPRLQIRKGSVAIGGSQTGIYPMASPGGWNVIGNTPVTLFDATKQSPCFVKPGDKVRFKPVSLDEYKSIKILVEAGVYQIESEVIRD
ncbi:5-oxoprolinase subunit PxpB [Aestuariibaculum suncheonense]|uniref:5-oxoprolinase subunit PxpB n=1 Tax=Aestuariibaculum suncheonense TaxID=1028745 RepID=A0A8J6UAX9_9FLAO|nr:5-oxoprolinase subunit PxpB [Aestuariibaculum suncheonense]MBD0835798.1 5-oxoprolinase subunit PxpB [Aestuariibaculum suncheonense]